MGNLINKLDIYDIYYFNVKHEQSLQIKKLLEKNISNYKKTYKKKQKAFTELFKTIEKLTINVNGYDNQLCDLIKNNKNNTNNNSENLQQAYSIKPCDEYTSSEFISDLNKIDYSILFRMYVLYNTITSPKTVIMSDLHSKKTDTNDSNIKSEMSEDNSLILSVTPINRSKSASSSSSDCKNINVVKIYLYLDDLIQDNNHIIYTDTNTREVKADDYAILFENAMNISYYKRINNKWAIDILIPNTYIYDSPYMFCNNNLMCARDFTTQTCVPVKTIIKHIIANIHNEIEKPNLELHNPIIEYTHDLLESYYNRTIKLSELYRNNQQKYTKIKYTLGTTREFNEVILSPYLDEFITILGEPTFKKRQEFILAFCNAYTRIYNNKNNLETVHWRYCIKTDVALVPSSIYNIAMLYNLYSGDIPTFNYQLELLKKEISIIS